MKKGLKSGTSLLDGHGLNSVMVIRGPLREALREGSRVGCVVDTPYAPQKKSRGYMEKSSL